MTGAGDSSTARPANIAAMRVPEPLIRAIRLRREGKVDQAVVVLEEAITDIRTTGRDVAFRDRQLLANMLADLYLMTDRDDRARRLITDETEYVEQVEPNPAVAAALDQLRGRALQLDLLQNPAPEIEVAEWVRGGPTTLAMLRGGVVLVDFWARSCAPCLAGFPALGELMDRYRDAGLHIVALTRYGEAEQGTAGDRAGESELIGEVIAEHLRAEIAVGIAPDSGTQDSYGVNRMPTAVIIDRKGIVKFISTIPDKAKIEAVVRELIDDGKQRIRG